MLRKRMLFNQDGSTMIMVLMVMVVLLILGTALIGTSIAENKFAAKNEDRIQAYYIARTGAQSVAEYIIYGDAADIIGKTSEPNTQIGGGTFTVSIDEDAENNIYNIISVGQYNETTQTAKIRITTTGSGVGGIFQYAIAAKSSINIGNASGSGLNVVGAAAAKLGPVDLGIHGSASGGTIVDSTLIFPPIEVPETFDLTYSSITSNLTIASDSSALLNVSVGSINLGNNKSITITGDGIVHMYVDGNITFGTQSSFSVADEARLYIYVTGSRTISLSGRGAQNNVFIYAPDSTINFNNASPHMEFYGAIIGNEINLHNMLTIKHNPEMYNQINLDKSGIGIEYSGYSWFE
jgi:Tfp pilus assembly protein PilX